MIFSSAIGFRDNICWSNVPFRRARQVLKSLLDQHAVLKVLAERMPVKVWVPVLALQRALGRADILPWIVSTHSAVVCARNAYNIRTTFVGTNTNIENRCVVFCGPDCADAVDEARIINNAELLAAAVTTDDSKYTRVQRWLERAHTAVAARPAASTKRRGGRVALAPFDARRAVFERASPTRRCRGPLARRLAARPRFDTATARGHGLADAAWRCRHALACRRGALRRGRSERGRRCDSSGRR
jgi:hypothetical protein